MDESRLDMWSYNRRSWARAGEHNVFPKNTPLVSRTIYGAIGLGPPVIHLAKGCKNESLDEFIPILRDAFKGLRSKVKPVLVLD